jgi:hypothetical protein
VAFLVFKIIKCIQEDTVAEAVFWENLEIDIRQEAWVQVILAECAAAKPYG